MAMPSSPDESSNGTKLSCTLDRQCSFFTAGLDMANELERKDDRLEGHNVCLRYTHGRSALPRLRPWSLPPASDGGLMSCGLSCPLKPALVPPQTRPDAALTLVLMLQTGHCTLILLCALKTHREVADGGVGRNVPLGSQ
ncbi:hypothetical protein EYF80_016408 [Liparis tanakae]|uniref:Uncharacterized protein n=1 Tax=Liparis tanakae TaxID=230148 RepID=A0A4Z2I711_9TELE|nr:hypothetical protein EYF80_016408 [Liparis tanakae]